MRSILGLFAILLCLLPLAAQTTLYVDAANTPPGSGTKADPFQSITSALQNAGPGDTILVAPGIYSPTRTAEILPISLGTRNTGPVVDHTNLSLIATEGAAVTTIDCESSTSIALRWWPNSTGALVRGFTIVNSNATFMVRNGSTSAGFEGSPGMRLDRCRLIGTAGRTTQGIALLLAGPGHQITNNWIYGPISDNGIWVSVEGSANPGGGLIAHNVIDGSLNNGLRVQGGAWTVQNNLFTNCVNRGVLDRVPSVPGVPVNYSFDHNGYFGNGLNIDDGGTGGTGLMMGVNSIIADPQYVDQPNNDYHLLPTSPCIDAGTLATPANAVFADFDDDSRANPGPSGTATPDIGADEQADVRLTAIFAPSVTLGIFQIDTTGPATDAQILAFSLLEAPIYAPGLGHLRLSLDPFALVILDPNPQPLFGGVASFAFPTLGLPVGFTFYAQALVFGPSGVRLTNALRLVVCP